MRYKTIRFFSGLCFVTVVVLFTVGIFGLLRFGSYVKKTTGITPFSAFALLLDGESMIHTIDGRVNVLLLGIGGENHEGGDLTDTIIIASFAIQEKTLSLISIPRDVWSETLKDKINSAYHYGEEKKKGGGLPLAKAVIEDMIGIPLQYSIVYDFSQFASFVDSVGGIDAAVEKPFTDTMYPIAGKENDLCDGDPTYACRYETVTFSKGTEHMDGARALKYVRSRHGDSDEGTDFARSSRQQEIVGAVKNKLFALNLFLHPKYALTLLATFDKATDSDMTMAENIALGKFLFRIGDKAVQRISLESYLIEAPTWKYDRYVLEPKEDWETIQTFIKEELSKR